MPEDPDRELVSRCQVLGSEDFEEAFAALYQRYKDRVYSTAFRVTGKRSDALDASQEAFVLVYQNLPGFKFESKFSSWLYRLVVNASIDLLRRRKSRNRGTESIESMAQVHGQDPTAIEDEAMPAPSAALDAKELSLQVQRAISGLSPKLRVVTVLRYLQGLSYEDCAETLEISLGTIKSRLARAHLALGETLKALAGELSSTPAKRDSESRAD